MKINIEKKFEPLWTPFAPILGGSSADMSSKNLERNAPIPEDTLWAKNSKLIILTKFA